MVYVYLEVSELGEGINNDAEDDVEADGGFRVRVEMPNKRQVIPIMAQSATGLERQTVVMAVERNTKAMEPHLCEADEL